MLDWLACNVVKTSSWFLCRLPPSVSVWLGQGIGLLLYWTQPKRTQIGVVNLRAAFHGQETAARAPRIIRDCYVQLGAAITEMLRLPVMDRAYVDRYITVEGRHHFEKALATKRPVIFLTGHYGNWELSSIAAALHGYPIVALARAQEKLPKLYRLLVSYRESKGCTIVHKGGAMKRLITILEQRKLVGIVGDQASRQGVFVNFFGRPAPFATGPFALAYEKDAVLLPVFIHRTRGPFHRMVIEPPITFSHRAPKETAVRSGVEQFANILTRHITESPHQWLWMHKRWKHTPTRRVLVLSDGKLGHLKQSLAVVEALRERHPGVTHEVVALRYRHALARGLALLWSGWMPSRAGALRALEWTLAPKTAAVLLTRHADVIISCGASMAPANLLWAAENRAKSVVIMNPAPLGVSQFDLVIAPRHDRLPRRANVVQTVGAIAGRMSDASLAQAQERLAAHPKFKSPVSSSARGRQQGAARRQPVITVFLGGDTSHHRLLPGFVETLIGHVITVCEAVDGWCLVTTSRRTSPAVERLLARRLSRDPRCRLLLLATRDHLDGTMEGMLGSADVVVVTGESISMVSEACASGRRVVVVRPPLRRDNAVVPDKHRRFFQQLVRDGHVQTVPVSDLSLTIQGALKARSSSPRLDNFSVIRDAVARLL